MQMLGGCSTVGALLMSQAQRDVDLRLADSSIRSGKARPDRAHERGHRDFRGRQAAP